MTAPVQESREKTVLRLARIRQLFPQKGLDSPEQELISLLQSEGFNNAIAGRRRICVAVGSRGISNLAILVRALVSHLRLAGREVFVVPAMGSHGHARADGQKMVLESLGISQSTVGVEIVSSMEVISVGQVELDGRQFQAYVDRAAWEQADGIILMNRIKAHTDFVGQYESGLVKLSTVGLGNHEGAKQVHAPGTRGLKKLMPALAQVILSHEKIVGGLGIIEDSYHQTAGLHWLNRDEILPREPALLKEAISLTPRFPINDIDLLIIKQMGKEISGVGIDTKVVGRLMVAGEPEPSSPNIDLMAICDITDASYGNALGVGLADFITQRLLDRIDFHALHENILTETFYGRGKIPLTFADERAILEVGLNHFRKRGREKARVIIIRDTLNLSDMYVSEGVLEELEDYSGIEIISELQEVRFDENNRIIADFPPAETREQTHVQA